MKEPLLRLDPTPDLDPGTDLESADEPAVPEEAEDLLSMSQPEPLINPLTLAAPPSSPKRRALRISWVVLAVAGTAVLLSGVLLGMRMSDYYHGRYFDKRFAKLLTEQVLPLDVHPTLPDPAVAPAPLAPPPPAPLAQVSLSEPAPQAPVSPSPTVPAPLPGSKAVDFGGELEALRQERQLMTQRFEQLNAARRPSSPGADVSTAPSPGGLPDSPLPSATPSFGKAGSAKPSSSPLSAEDQRVRDAPAIARVREYDADWHFVILDGGKERNLTPGTQLAVRRGHEILGLIRVDEVEEKESVAELQGTWRTDPQAKKPSRGDDVVTYPLF